MLDLNLISNNIEPVTRKTGAKGAPAAPGAGAKAKDGKIDQPGRDFR